MAGVKRDIRKNRVRTKKHYAKFTLPADIIIEYKNLPVLQRFLTDRGKIMSRRITGITAKQQRAMCIAIKRARFLGLLPSGGVKRI